MRGRGSIAVLAWAACGGSAAAQAPVPLGDSVETPLLPTGIVHQDAALSGVLLYLWKDAESGAHVLHFVGDFEMRLGERRLQSREAVVWMYPRLYESVPYRYFEVFLWQDARLEELGGTLTEAPLLFVTLASRGEVALRADRMSRTSSADTWTYSQAVTVRQRLTGDGTSATSESATTSEQTPPSPPLVRGGTSASASSTKGESSASPPLLRGGLGGSEQPTDHGPVYYRADSTEVGQAITAIGNVYVFQGDPEGNDFLELRADAAVLFRSVGAEPQAPAEVPPPAGLLDRGEAVSGAVGGSEVFGAESELLGSTAIEAVYLEGDIVLSRGERSVRASRLYYDFVHQRALILDAVLRTTVPQRNVPLYLRADEIRQLSENRYAADDAKLTTSEFFTPHYHIGAEHVELVDRGVAAGGGGVPSFRAGTFSLRNSTFNIGGVPVLYWPYAQGNFETGEMTLQGVRTGYSSRFGAEVETRWNLFNLLGVPTPPGFDATFRLDYFNDRGPATGLDLNYETDDSFGLYRGYYVNDHGRDNLPWYLDNEPDSPNRGRSTWRHREYLADDWQLTLEASYVTDRGFLEEYFEREFDVGKEQETLLYLKKQRDNWAFTALGQWRILDWYTQTEHLPDFSFRLIGEPLGDRVTAFSENRAGWVRYRSGDQTLLEKVKFGANPDDSDIVTRGDTRQEIEAPFSLGPIKVVPFGSARGSGWDDSPTEGSVGRFLGTYGLRSSMYLSRVFPSVESELFDIHGVRHIIKPDATVWLAHGNQDSHNLYLFDENVEDVDELDGATVGVRQRFQTRRGAGDRLRTVDVLTVDVEAGAFNDNPGTEYTYGFASYSRPENSIARNFVNANTIYRINDSTALASEANYDMNDGEIDVFNVSYAVERDPRYSYVLGYRFIEEADSNLLGLAFNYRLTEKHTVALREEFDLERAQSNQFVIGYVRKLPRWYVSIEFDVDEVDDDFGVSVSAWPEGLPNVTLGSHRFTGLADSIGIRPD